jgi:hypothetical protein
MSDAEQIEQAYAEKLQQLFAEYLQSFTDAQGNADLEREADERFKKDVVHIRHVRERALNLIV